MNFFLTIKTRLTIVFAIFFVFEVVAQDKQFSQFYSIPLTLAPSFAGATKQHRVSSVYRNQWYGVNGYVSYFLSYDHNFSKYYSGLGVSVLRDYAGSGKLGLFETAISYSYDINTDKREMYGWHIRPGLGFVYTKYNVDFSKLMFPDQLTSQDPSNTTIESSPNAEPRGTVDAAVSTIVYKKDFWSGFTVDHLFSPNRGFYFSKARVPIKYTLFGGGHVLRRSSLLKPVDESLLLAYMYRRQGDFQQLDLGIYWYKIPLILGIWYRGIPMVNSPNGDAVTFLVGYKIPQLSFGYSYDFTVSGLMNSSGGSHELSVNYTFITSPRKKFRSIPCPDF